jgi:TetR/AcrR family transcriptional regulator, regulator of cefoperazone and chloramphenicol sensitivity
MRGHAYNHPRRRNRRSANPRARIMRAATQLFAERGFHNTTTRMISAKAGTNLASVNYYFRSKEHLHEAVFEATFASLAPLIGARPSIATQAQWEQALYRWLNTVFEMIFDPSPEQVWRLQLYERARTEPTAISPVVRAKFLYPIRDALQDLLRLGLPADVPPATLMAWTLSTIGQFLIFTPHGHADEKDLFPRGMDRKAWAAVLARHITDGITARLAFGGATPRGKSGRHGK